jgi:hypothetical protein
MNDGPTIVDHKGGDKYWYKNGNLHRDGGPAVEYSNSVEWYKNGELHRDDGPAIEYANGNKFWYKYDCLHRTDGPAIEYANGYIEWWVNDTRLTLAEFAAKVLDKETALLWKMSGYCQSFDLELNK